MKGIGAQERPQRVTNVVSLKKEKKKINKLSFGNFVLVLFYVLYTCTVDSRYLELAYLE